MQTQTAEQHLEVSATLQEALVAAYEVEVADFLHIEAVTRHAMLLCGSGNMAEVRQAAERLDAKKADCNAARAKLLNILHALRAMEVASRVPATRCDGNCAEIQTGPDGEPGLVYCEQCEAQS
jgi:hypothetical protein